MMMLAVMMFVMVAVTVSTAFRLKGGLDLFKDPPPGHGAYLLLHGRAESEEHGLEFRLANADYPSAMPAASAG